MSREHQRLIALLTDFGTRDWYVAAMKAVILSRCPSARLIDITHEVPPQDIIAGAFTISAAAPWFPRGTIFVAVVDPDVGSHRALLAARADGCYFLGPDNGLLALSLERARQLTIVRLKRHRSWLRDLSHTFHARDILAPVAAYLACGGSFTQLGVAMTRLAPLPLPRVQRDGRRLIGHIVHVDRFGNLITNLPGEVFTPRVGAHAILRYKGRRVRMVSSYAAGRPHELIAIVGSLRLVELAVKGGSAALAFNARRGECVTLVS